MRVHVGYTRLPGLFQVDSVFVFFGEGGFSSPIVASKFQLGKSERVQVLLSRA